MRIELLIEPGDPPFGTVIARGGSTVRFAGWLDLLGVLAQLAGEGTGAGCCTADDVLEGEEAK